VPCSLAPQELADYYPPPPPAARVSGPGPLPATIKPALAGLSGTAGRREHKVAMVLPCIIGRIAGRGTLSRGNVQ
jgi:hypothetical protein